MDSCARCENLASGLERALNAFKTLKSISPEIESDILIKSLENLLTVNAAASHPPASAVPATRGKCCHRKKPAAVVVSTAATQTETDEEIPAVIKTEPSIGRGNGDCLVEPKVWQQVKASVIKVDQTGISGGGDIIYKCPHCSKRCSSCQTTIKHILVVHRNYDVHCPTCKQKFFFKATLENHMASCKGMRSQQAMKRSASSSRSIKRKKKNPKKKAQRGT